MTTLQLAAILVHMYTVNSYRVSSKKWFCVRFLAVEPELFVIKEFIWLEFLQL